MRTLGRTVKWSFTSALVATALVVTVALAAAVATPALAVGSAAEQATPQPGTIVGTVSDAGAGTPLSSAQVHIPALGLGVLSRDAGRFVLPGVPAGTHDLHVELIGFSSVVRTVTVASGETATVDVQLHSMALELVEVVVTGTAFRESPVTLPYSVSVSSRRSLAEQGAPQATDFFKNLSASHGALGERHSYANTAQPGAVPETIASVNLRGLGPSRTLVLLNGRRHTYVPVRMYGGRFVDVNSFPSISLDRIEILKEGASAVYGSDAVAGVANFLTRNDFEGLEFTASHEYYDASGATTAGGIWGRPAGANAQAVISAEVLQTQYLKVRDRGFAQAPFVSGAGGWSFVGNPGAFLFPDLAGDEGPKEFAAALRDAQFGGNVFVDPACEAFGGYREPETCRMRYQSWDDLQQASTYFRSFGEINGGWGDGGSFHVEALYARTATPKWSTTPSFAPIYQYDGAHLVSASNPGRQHFCNNTPQAAGFASAATCLQDDWYFYGRTVGNSGPARLVSRSSQTLRVAASADRAVGTLAGEDVTLEGALGWSRATGNVSLPAEYAHRRFLAFRGFGGPNCGVDVVPDASSPSGMALGPLGGAVAGEDGCLWYNPFSSAIQYSQQPGARFESEANPEYIASLANSPELRAWLFDQVDLRQKTNLAVADAMVKGTLAEGVANFAAGYQFRWFGVSAQPNDAGNLLINPCPVLGDQSCAAKIGPFSLINGFYPDDASQTVHRFFAEVPLTFGDRISAQAAANYEFHSLASSFDPRLALRVQLSDALALRVSVQTTFRTPSVDDVNELQNTATVYVPEAEAWRATDNFGNPDLEPEQAFTYNVGASFLSSRMRAAVDYWAYDFRNLIDVLPYAGVTRLYHAGGASRDAVKEFISCPDGIGTGTCASTDIERIRVGLVNWPGATTSGIDWHASARLPAGEGVVSLGADGTWTREYRVKALTVNGAEVYGEQSAAGLLNWFNPVAPPLPQWKLRFSAGLHRGDYSLVNWINSISSYTNESFVGTQYETIPRVVTWDLSLLRRARQGFDIALTAANLLDTPAPFVAWEHAFDAFTHSARGRRVKLSATWKGGG